MSAYAWVNALGGLLIVTSTMVVLARSAKKSAILYALQSFVLVLLLVSLAFATDSEVLFMWSASAFITKVVLVPGMLLFLQRKLGADSQDLGERLSPFKSITLIALEVLICFAAIQGVDLYTAAEVKPALAISLAHFFIGLTCIVSQRNIVKQIFGYCLMENGSHVTLALLAPQAPELVEIGIATDAIFAVLIMVLMVLKIYKTTKTLDTRDLMELRG